jgi:proteasome lid subunit RPN8/RPN11
MKPRLNQGTVGRCVAVTTLLLVNACSGVDGEGLDQNEAEEDGATAEGALHDALIMDGSAKLALVSAAKASVRSASDVTNPQYPSQVEYCGLIFKKSTGGFSASDLDTTHELRHCKAVNVPIPAGATVVGFHHTHTPDSGPGISEDDKIAAKASKRVYYVVSTKYKCSSGNGYLAEKWDPAVGGAPSHVGCLFF